MSQRHCCWCGRGLSRHEWLSLHRWRWLCPSFAWENSAAVDESGDGSSSSTQDELPADEQSSVHVLFSVPRRLCASSARCTSTDDFGERAAELGAHRAVQDEVDRAIDDDRGVPDVTERNVDVVEYTPINSAEERQKTHSTSEKTFKESIHS